MYNMPAGNNILRLDAMMPMFNQSSRSSMLFSLDAAAFGQGTGGFLNNDSPYVHALNRALQLEQAAVSVYAACQRGRSQVDLYRERTSCHHHALRELVRLIFAQRAIPDSDPASFIALTSTMAARASRWMPQTVKLPVLEMGSHRIEAALCRRYEKLVEMAPTTDRGILENLLEQTRDFCDESL